MKNFYFYQKKVKKRKKGKPAFPAEKFTDGIWSAVHRHTDTFKVQHGHSAIVSPLAEHIAGSNCSLYLCVGLEIDRHTCGFCGTCTVIFNSCVFFYSWCEYSGVKA